MISLVIDRLREYSLLYVLWGGDVLFIYLGVLRKKHKVFNISIIIAYVIYICMVLFRKIDYGVGGIDAINYKRHFEMAVLPYGTYMMTINKERGFYTILWLFYHIIPNYSAFIFFVHSVAFVLCIKCLNQINIKKRGFISWIYIFLFTVLLFNMFNLLRVSVAAYLSTFSLFHSIQGRKRISLFYAVMAVTIHTSAFPVLLAIILLHFKEREPRIKMIHLVCAGLFLEILLVVYLYWNPIHSDLYELYRNFNSGSLATGRILAIILGLLILQKKKNKQYDILLTATLIIPMNYLFAISNRMYMQYLPFLFTVYYEEIPININLRNLKYFTMKRLLLLGALFYMIIDSVKWIIVGIPESMGKFSLII